MIRLIAFFLMLACIGTIAISAYDVARSTVHHAQHAQRMRVFCAEAEYSPRVVATQSNLEAYAAACKGGE